MNGTERLNESETFELLRSLDTTLRLLTKAGILQWKVSESDRITDVGRHIVGEIKQEDIEQTPRFVTTMQIEAGMLEEILAFPTLVGKPLPGGGHERGEDAIIEEGLKVALYSYDPDDDNETGEATFDASLELLAEIELSLRLRKELYEAIDEAFRKTKRKKDDRKPEES